MLRPDYGATHFFGVGGAFIVGVVSLLIGAVLMIIWYSKSSRREAADASIKEYELVL